MICWTYRKGILVKRSIGTEGENAHEKPEILKLLAFTIAVIAISSLLFGCTKQKSEPMTNIWVSPYYISNWLYNAEGKYLHTGADGEVTADSTMEILRESTWPMGVTATMPKYLIPDTEKLRFEVTSKNAWMRVDSDKNLSPNRTDE